MSKLYWKILSLFFLSLSMVSIIVGCSDDMEITDMGEDFADHINLTINTGDNPTRATISGEDYYNENLIKSVDIFFFPADGDEDTPAVKAEHVAGLNAKNTTTVHIKLSLTQVPILFGADGGSDCNVYAVVNCPQTASLNNPSKSDLDAIEVGIKSSGAEGFNTRAIQESFVMYSGPNNTISYNKSSNSASGTINVNRVAAKVRLAVNVDQTVYQDVDGRTQSKRPDETDEEFTARMEAGFNNGDIIKWKPQMSNLKTFIVNGVNNARLDGSLTEQEDGNTEKLLDPVYHFSGTLERGAFRDLKDPATATDKPAGLPESPSYDGIDYSYYNWLPFYTYPNTWSNTMNENSRTTLTIMVPWQQISKDDGSTNYRNTYYTIPLTRATDVSDIFSNYYYRIMLHIGVIGSFEILEPIELEASYTIEPWGQQNINTDINDYRYLVVNQKEWYVHGEEDVTIPFYSSHDTEVIDVTFTYYNFNDYWGTRQYSGEPHVRTFKEEVNNRTKERNNGEGIYSYSIDNSNRTLTFHHPFVDWIEYDSRGNQISNDDANAEPYYFMKGTDYPITPYDITIKIRHTDQSDGTKFEETIVIHQLPSIYVQVEHNQGSRSSGTNYGNQYVIVNANTAAVTRGAGSGETWDFVANLSELNGGVNNNPNMYIINVTQLTPEEEGKYTIGDPRQLYRNMNLTDESFLDAEIAEEMWYGGYDLFEWAPVNTLRRRVAFVWAISRSGSGNIYNPFRYVYVPSMYPDDKPKTIGNNELAFEGNRTDYRNFKNNLYFYYPGDETLSGNPGSKETFIAPTFRIASSFGKTVELNSKEYARRRCASYQEAGYPAGRWRLPTKAEIEYVVKLSNKRKIPILFGLPYAKNEQTNQDHLPSYARYYTTTGPILLTNDGYDNLTLTDDPSTAEGGRAVRCVYDDWYWYKDDGVTPDKLSPTTTTFTWGDKEKKNPQQIKKLLNKAKRKK